MRVCDADRLSQTLASAAAGISRAQRETCNEQSGGVDMKTPSVPNTEEFAADLLCGADEIAKFLFGPRGGRRKVYYLAACTRIPVFRLGTKLCARRTVLLSWISAQENRALIQSNTGSTACAEAEAA